MIITNPEQIKEVFNKMQDFPKPKLNSIAKLFSVGLIQSEGAKWAKHRKIITPAFHTDKLKVKLCFSFLHVLCCQTLIFLLLM